MQNLDLKPLFPSHRRGFGVSVLAVSLSLSFIGCHSAPNDTTLANNVRNAIAADPAIHQQPVLVTAQKGVVTLTGNVSDSTAGAVAAQDAARVSGVKEVVNGLTVNSQPVTPTITSSEAPTQPRDATPQEQQIIASGKALPPPSGAVSSSSAPPAPAPPPAPVVRSYTAPVGTDLSVRITESLSSQTAQDGQPINGTVTRDVVHDGVVIVPSGSAVSGRVVAAKDAGHFKGHSLLAIEMTSLRRRGETVPIATSTYTVEGKNRGKNSAEKIGGGAAIGAVLGGVFGGGRGAGIGALAGGGGGTILQGVTRGQQVSIPSESLIRFRLERSLTVRTSEAPSSTDNSGLRTR